MAKRKPWQGVNWESIETPDLTSLSGLVELCRCIEKLTKWRKSKWKATSPQEQKAIDEEVSNRLKTIGNIQTIIRNQVTHGSEEEQQGTLMLILAGMAMHRQMAIWQDHMAANAADHSNRARKLGEENAKNAFRITRGELLIRCRKVYRRYECNQKELREHVAEGLLISGARVKQLMKKHKIYKADYA